MRKKIKSKRIKKTRNSEINKNNKTKKKKNTKKTVKDRKIKKRISLKKVKKLNKKDNDNTLNLVGEVIHFYNNISVAVIKFKKDIKKGDKVFFKGATTNFKQVLNSIQINHQFVDKVKKNQIAGVKVKKRVREKDKVYLLV